MKPLAKCTALITFAVSLVLAAPAQQGPTSVSAFPPFLQWQSNLLAHDIGGLEAMYSADPPARVVTPQGKVVPGADDASFWKQQMDAGLSAFTADVAESSEPQPGVRQIIFQAELRNKSSAGTRTSYVSCLQVWQQQGSQWKLLASGHGNVARLKQPMRLDPNLYPEGADAGQEISDALARAKAHSKRVLLVFGANWCYDCDVLDLAFHHPDLQPFLEKNFVVTHIDIGRMDKNVEIAKRYEVPLEKGIPAVAVLDSSGKLLYSQRNGEFESARSLGPEDISAFLAKWSTSR